jgi:hypothetical protein
MLHKQLKERKDKLQKLLRELSAGGVEIVEVNEKNVEGKEWAVEFNRNTRIREAKLRLHLWEQFRDLDTDPSLYAFSYWVTSDEDTQRERPLFRYECHPDVGDEWREGGERSSGQNPYAINPHFHPDKTDLDNVRKLHFPFHREERKTIIFSLVSWIQVDLVNRFYKKVSTPGTRKS